MRCSAYDNFVPSVSSVATDADAGSAFGKANSPTLVVSNSPETLTEIPTAAVNSPNTETYTLFRGSRVVSAGTKRHRVFLWHVNAMEDVTIHVHLSVSCDSGMNVSNRKWSQIVCPLADIEAAGICIAKSQLFTDFDDEELVQFAVVEEEAIWGTEVPGRTEEAQAGHLVALIMEFDTTYYDTGSFLVRTSMSPDTSLQGSMSDPQADFDEHVRGWWDCADVIIDCGDMDARREIPFGTNPSTYDKRIGCCEDGGPEESLFPGDLGSSDPDGNKGLYGANLIYQVTLKNTGNVSNSVSSVIRVRGTGQRFFGAAAVVEPSGYDRRGVPELFSTQNGPHQVQTLINETTGQVTLIPVTASETDLLYEIIVANAGASTTPFNIELYAERIIATPPEGGGDN